MCMWVCMHECVCRRVCIHGCRGGCMQNVYVGGYAYMTCVEGVCMRELRMPVEFPGTELQAVISSVGAMNRRQVLCKSSMSCS